MECHTNDIIYLQVHYIFGYICMIKKNQEIYMQFIFGQTYDLLYFDTSNKKSACIY